MKIVGCDLHAKQQTIAMVDSDTGEFIEKTLVHEGNVVREFYAALEGPVIVGIEATASLRAPGIALRLPQGAPGRSAGSGSWSRLKRKRNSIFTVVTAALGIEMRLGP